jgi:hypothetical protein
MTPADRPHVSGALMRARLQVARMDRWQIQRRLSELSIQSQCDPFGNILVEVQYGVEIAQIHSVVRQCRSDRSELVAWLERCWRRPVALR